MKHGAFETLIVERGTPRRHRRPHRTPDRRDVRYHARARRGSFAMSSLVIDTVACRFASAPRNPQARGRSIATASVQHRRRVALRTIGPPRVLCCGEGDSPGVGPTRRTRIVSSGIASGTAPFARRWRWSARRRRQVRRGIEQRDATIVRRRPDGACQLREAWPAHSRPLGTRSTRSPRRSVVAHGRARDESRIRPREYDDRSAGTPHMPDAGGVGSRPKVARIRQSPCRVPSTETRRPHARHVHAAIGRACSSRTVRVLEDPRHLGESRAHQRKRLSGRGRTGVPARVASRLRVNGNGRDPASDMRGVRKRAR